MQGFPERDVLRRATLSKRSPERSRATLTLRDPGFLAVYGAVAASNACTVAPTNPPTSSSRNGSTLGFPFSSHSANPRVPTAATNKWPIAFKISKLVNIFNLICTWNTSAIISGITMLQSSKKVRFGPRCFAPCGRKLERERREVEAAPVRCSGGRN